MSPSSLLLTLSFMMVMMMMMVIIIITIIFSNAYAIHDIFEKEDHEVSPM